MEEDYFKYKRNKSDYVTYLVKFRLNCSIFQMFNILIFSRKKNHFYCFKRLIFLFHNLFLHEEYD